MNEAHAARVRLLPQPAACGSAAALLLATSFAALLAACTPGELQSSEDASGMTGDAGGSSGSAGNGGTTAGTAGDAGAAGSSGSAGSGGTTGGAAGAAGSSGSAGNGGSTGGTAGTAGAAGGGGGSAECGDERFWDSEDCVMELTELGAGQAAACGVVADGGAFCWGRLVEAAAPTWKSRTPIRVPPPPGSRFSIIATGDWHACALDQNAAAFCWGLGTNGQLGNKSETSAHTAPVAVLMPEGKTFSAIAAGQYHSCALDQDGAAYCWGYGNKGQIGNNDRSDQDVPEAATMPNGIAFSRLFAGNDHSCALDATGDAYCWGNSESLVPEKVDMPEGHDFEQVTAGRIHSCAIDKEGAAFCWGYGGEGQLGRGSYSSTPAPEPVSMPEGHTFSRITAGWAHSCALDETGAAYCWGRGDSGELGNGDESDSPKPVPVSMPEGRTFNRISAGDFFTCALDQQGVAFCWGKADDGQLGIGSSTDQRSSPTKVHWPD